MLILAFVFVMSGERRPNADGDDQFLGDMFGSDSEDHGDQYLGDMFGSDSEDHRACANMHGACTEPLQTTGPSSAPLPPLLLERATSRPTGQGRYDRSTSVARRLSHAEYAWNHFKQAEENAIGVPCTEACAYDRKCGRNFTPTMLLAAHERVYGTGVQMLDGKFHCHITEAYSHKAWRSLFLSWVTRRADDPTAAPTERFTVEGQGPVCANYCRAVYFGLDARCRDGFAHSSAWNKYLAAARSGTLSADDRVERSADSSALAVLRNPRGVDDQAAFECIEWWVSWLRIEDQAPGEPVIMHRRIPMNQVHEIEYSADMKWWGTAFRVLSRERWTAYRSVALKQLSVEFFGQVSDCDPHDVRLSISQKNARMAGGGIGEPVQLLSLRQRAKHGNFGKCARCEAALSKWTAYRSNPERGTLEDANAIKRDIFQHVQEVQEERRIAMQFHQEAARSSIMSYQYDDKCGSSFLHQPSPKCRPGANATRWQYRWALHGNIYAGDFLRFSMVPKCLQTGINFGNSAYFSAMVRAAELGVLGEETTRQTDSGPDCDAQEAHALHVELVSRGVVNKLRWLRLQPKHSHNFADRANSMVKAVIWPQHGVGGGCEAPWDMAAITEKAMASQRGVVELAWHWNNFDWRARYAGHISKDFTNYGDVRVWEYDYDPTLTDRQCVRVTYRDTLLTTCEDGKPLMRPFAVDNAGRLITDPKGLKIMTSLPTLAKPTIEPWIFAESSDAEGAGAQTQRAPGAQDAPSARARDKPKVWHKTKVFSDVSTSQLEPSSPLFDRDPLLTSSLPVADPQPYRCRFLASEAGSMACAEALSRYLHDE
jgi:hypothetical protein